ncbi:hypothetical protein R1sor_020013 [Riccia sorocarpa]|uniref:Uncharacterized protein n=1 Tax=Riccia sorocarpa TaxID=122646 RepID=A0ABD3IET5_9MARC
MAGGRCPSWEADGVAGCPPVLETLLFLCCPLLSSAVPPSSFHRGATEDIASISHGSYGVISSTPQQQLRRTSQQRSSAGKQEGADRRLPSAGGAERKRSGVKSALPVEIGEKQEKLWWLFRLSGALKELCLSIPALRLKRGCGAL